MNPAAQSLLSLVLAAGLTACAVRGPAATTPEQLAEAGERELARGRGASDLPLPPGLNPQRVQAAGSKRATMPLSKVLERLTPQREPAAESPLSEEDQREALKRYAAGRALLREGDARSAARELAAATSLDPGAGEIWILRAEAELAAGQRSSGARSLQRGVALGAGGAVHREALAREAIEQRRFEEAAALLAEARQMGPAAESPALALVIDAQLGVAVEALGYDAAARELLLGVAPALADAAPTGRFAPLIASAIRQQARYWTLIGDLSCRLGDYAGAFEAYRQAAAAPGGNQADLAAAQVYAALRAGAPSHAAAIAMEAVNGAGEIAHSGAALLAYVAGVDERAGAALQRALAARLESIEDDEAARANLAVALAALQPAPKARRTLLRAHAASPHNVDLIRAVARSAADSSPEEAAQLGAQMIRAAPMRSGAIAWSILRAHRETDAVIASAAGSGDPAARVLAAWALHFTGRPDRGLAALGSVTDPALAPVAQATRAQLAASAGEWDVLEQAIADLAGAETAQGRRAYSFALAAAQRYDDALAAAAPLAEAPDPPPGLLAEAAMLAQRAGERQRALEWLDRAVQADPRDEAAHELRIRALSEVDSEEGRERLARAMADLQRMMPGSAMLDLLEASALASRGRFREAQERLLALAEDPLRADDALGAAEDMWTSRRRMDVELLEQAHDWLAARAPQRPQSPATARALAAVLVALDRPEEAGEALRAAIDRYGWPELQVALEGVLRAALGRPEEADQLALERLTTGPAGVDELVQLAALRARRGELAEAAAAAQRIPAQVRLTRQQGQRLVEAARLGAEAVGRAAGASAADAAAIFDEAQRLAAPAPAEFHERRLDLLTSWEGAAPDRIARALVYAARQLDEDAGRLAGAVAGAMEQAGRGAEGLATFDALAQMDEPLPLGAVDAWLILVARAGDIDDARRFIDAARRAGMLCQALRLRSNVQEGASEVDCAVLALVALAEHWELEERPDQVIEAYRMVWELKPGDPGAANDLGYMLLEARQDLDEAARLIELAHEGEPDSGHVLDSIGWLRYRQGVFEDERGPGGEVVRYGAVTFLERAAATPRGQVSATIQEHFGDALWRVGRRPAARLAWQTARNLAGNQRGGQAAAISRKLRDALQGKEPELAEVYGELAEGDGGL